MLALVFQFSKLTKSYVYIYIYLFIYLLICSHTNHTFMLALNVEIIFAVYILTQMSHQTCGFQDASSPSVHLTISTFQRQTLYDLVQKTFEEARMGYEMCIVDWTWWWLSWSTSPSSLASWSPSSSSYSSYSSLFSSSFWWPSHPTAIFIHDASVLPPLAFLSASWWWIVMLCLLFSHNVICCFSLLLLGQSWKNNWLSYVCLFKFVWF